MFTIDNVRFIWMPEYDASGLYSGGSCSGYHGPFVWGKGPLVERSGLASPCPSPAERERIEAELLAEANALPVA